MTKTQNALVIMVLSWLLGYFGADRQSYRRNIHQKPVALTGYLNSNMIITWEGM
jgi:hypothetical protein